jgi:hypothetical protein
MVQRAFFQTLAAVAGLGALVGCASAGQQNLAAMYPMSTQALVGSTPQVLNAEFGQPVLLRTDGPAQVWLYHSQACGLNLFLYPDAGGVPRVAAAVPDHGDDPARCVQSLVHGVTAVALERPATS